MLDELQYVWEAWHRLSDGRNFISSGFGSVPAPLTFAEIDTYARRFGPAGHEGFDEFYRLVTAMDRAYLQHEAKKQKKSKKGKKKRPDDTPPPRAKGRQIQ